MKIVHGFLCGRLLVGVLAPVLSVAGEMIPSSIFLSVPALIDNSGVALPDCGGTGDAALLVSPSTWEPPAAAAAYDMM